MGGEDAAAALAATKPGGLDTLYALAVCLATRGRYAEALEHLFLLIEQNPGYRAGSARHAVMRILRIIGHGGPVGRRHWLRLGQTLRRARPRAPV